MSRQRLRGEGGQVTVFVVVVAVALVVAAGLVVDGGYTLAAERRAYNEAEAAARAGAQALSADALRAGTLEVDPGAATTAAQAYLAQTGHVGTVMVTGDTVAVDVSFVEPMRMLGMVGISELTVHGHGQATNVAGIQTVGG